MTTKNEKNVNTEEFWEIDLSILFRDFLRSFSKLWLVVVITTVLAAGVGYISAAKAYEPLYCSQATFTVETYTAQGGYTFFYDNHTAAQMARTFPYILESDLLLDRVKADLGVTHLKGTAEAKVIENSNLFTLSVTAKTPQAAYDTLQALIKNYPEVAQYVIGKTQLNMIDPPQVPTTPFNSANKSKDTLLGAAVGAFLGVCIVALFALARNTVRRESDITQKLHADCLGSVPLVVSRRGKKEMDLSVRNDKVGTPFKESFRGIALKVTRHMQDKKVLLITATNPSEGTSTVVRNLAYTLADQGKQVVVIGEKMEEEGNLQMIAPRKGKALKEQISDAKAQADLVLLDAPACTNWDATLDMAEQAEGILYVIRQDSAKLPSVMNCFEDLNQLDGALIGCVLNAIRFGITGYGYGYGYGYSKAYRYGRYGDYGYAEHKAGKYAARKKENNEDM